MCKIPMTVQGFTILTQELEELKKCKRPKIISAIAEARKHGDLKENAEYHAAREEQSFIEGRIQEITSKLHHAQIIDVCSIPYNGKIIFGATISILNMQSNQIFHFRIVGDDEADFRNNLISINSPIARGLIGKKISDITLIKTPLGDVNYKILNIEYI